MNKEEKEIFDNWQKERPKKIPGPQNYWVTEPFSKEKKNGTTRKKYSTNYNKDGSKIHVIDRQVTDRAVYKPTSRVIF